MDPKAALIAYMQQMQGAQGAPAPAGPPMPAEAMGAAPMQPGEPLGDPSSPDNTPAHENAESPELEKAEGSEEDGAGGEAYSHADMIAHHDSIAGLIQVLVNMTNSGPKAGGFKMSVPSQVEQNSASYAGK